MPSRPAIKLLERIKSAVIQPSSKKGEEHEKTNHSDAPGGARAVSGSLGCDRAAPGEKHDARESQREISENCSRVRRFAGYQQRDRGTTGRSAGDRQSLLPEDHRRPPLSRQDGPGEKKDYSTSHLRQDQG